MTEMTNSRREFMDALQIESVGCPSKCYEVLCSWIAFEKNYGPDKDNMIYLKKGHTPREYEEFLSIIDRDYDSGYGTQLLFGCIWLTNGEWIIRHEYDGSEGWEHVCKPSIPSECE